jgi:GntR family transcriptional regulator
VLARSLRINPASGIPIYVQLVEQIKHAIENCTLGPGDQLPGIRALAQDILVSPNTVIKAYSELEREEVIEVRHGSGAFVVDSERRRDRRKDIRAAQSMVRDFVERLRRRGLSDGEIRRCVEAELEIENQEVRRGR